MYKHQMYVCTYIFLLILGNGWFGIWKPQK